ncbi:MAG: hypothetical protein IPH51_18470 [Rubrivivax sp.]|nr:hypothetical protein [Rubrivivax sp.]
MATSLDLIFVALFSLGPLAAIMLALGLSLAVYALARQWILNQMVGASVLTTERTFEQLYRVAREVQDDPGRAAQAAVGPAARAVRAHGDAGPCRAGWQARVVGAGAALYTCAAQLGADAGAAAAPAPGSILIRCW